MIELPAARLAERIASGEIRSIDATEEFLRRIAHIDGRLNAFITVTADEARERAKEADDALARGVNLGRLHGLPIALKDNIDTANVRTTVGSAFFAERVPNRDAQVARRLNEAGAVMLGKLNMHEFAFGATTQNPHHGACRNPWDLDRIPGGSSGGSGAAVGAGLCAVAIGTDTGGSIRVPAALGGVTGLRPTMGRVSLSGVFANSYSFDTVGPLARSVEDIALVLGVIAGFDVDDPSSADEPTPPYVVTRTRDLAGMRIGIPQNFFFDRLDADVSTRVEEAAGVLANAGASLESIEIPGAERAAEATTQMIWAEAYAIHRQRLAEQPQLFGEDVRRRIGLGAQISGADYAESLESGRRWRRSLNNAFGELDLILTATSESTAPRAEEAEMLTTTSRLTRLTYGWSLAGIPAISLPCGFDRSGMPVGLQLAAAPFREETLLRTALVFQRETDWHLRLPSLSSTDEC